MFKGQDIPRCPRLFGQPSSDSPTQLPNSIGQIPWCFQTLDTLWFPEHPHTDTRPPKGRTELEWMSAHWWSLNKTKKQHISTNYNKQITTNYNKVTSTLSKGNLQTLKVHRPSHGPTVISFTSRGNFRIEAKGMSICTRFVWPHKWEQAFLHMSM